MIDRTQTIKALIENGYAIAIFAPVILLTEAPDSLHIGGLDVHVFHRDLKKPDHDSKPWKTLAGKEKRAQAQSEAEVCLAAAANASDILTAIMEKHTTI